MKAWKIRTTAFTKFKFCFRVSAELLGISLRDSELPSACLQVGQSCLRWRNPGIGPVEWWMLQRLHPYHATYPRQSQLVDKWPKRLYYIRYTSRIWPEIKQAKNHPSQHRPESSKFLVGIAFDVLNVGFLNENNHIKGTSNNLSIFPQHSCKNFWQIT